MTASPVYSARPEPFGAFPPTIRSVDRKAQWSAHLDRPAASM